MAKLEDQIKLSIKDSLENKLTEIQKKIKDLGGTPNKERKLQRELAVALEKENANLETQQAVVNAHKVIHEAELEEKNKVMEKQSETIQHLEKQVQNFQTDQLIAELQEELKLQERLEAENFLEEAANAPLPAKELTAKEIRQQEINHLKQQLIELDDIISDDKTHALQDKLTSLREDETTLQNLIEDQSNDIDGIGEQILEELDPSKELDPFTLEELEEKQTALKEQKDKTEQLLNETRDGILATLEEIEQASTQVLSEKARLEGEIERLQGEIQQLNSPLDQPRTAQEALRQELRFLRESKPDIHIPKELEPEPIDHGITPDNLPLEGELSDDNYLKLIDQLLDIPEAFKPSIHGSALPHDLALEAELSQERKQLKDIHSQLEQMLTNLNSLNTFEKDRVLQEAAIWLKRDLEKINTTVTAYNEFPSSNYSSEGSLLTLQERLAALQANKEKITRPFLLDNSFSSWVQGRQKYWTQISEHEDNVFASESDILNQQEHLNVLDQLAQRTELLSEVEKLRRHRIVAINAAVEKIQARISELQQ